MPGSIVIFTVASLLLIGTATAEDGVFSVAGSAIDGVTSFASSGFGPNFGGGCFDQFSFGGDLLKNVPGSNFVGTLVTSTTNADGTTEVTHKVTDGITCVVAGAGDLTDSKLPVVNDIVEKVVPEVIEQVTDDLDNGLGVEKIVDNVADTVGDVVHDAKLGKIVGSFLLKILTNRKLMKAVIRILVLLFRKL